MIAFFLFAAPAEAQPADAPTEIVVTAARSPQPKADTPASVTILDATTWTMDADGGNQVNLTPKDAGVVFSCAADPAG